VGSFLWQDVLRLQVLFRGIARCVLGNGATVTFWEDLWCNEVLVHKYPWLFSFARNEAISVQQFIQVHDLDNLFALPISPEAFVELLQLQDLLNQWNLCPQRITVGSLFGETKGIHQGATIKWCLPNVIRPLHSFCSGNLTARIESNSSCGWY
jgi:hypothetical protein